MAGPSRIAAALDYLERLKAQADQAGTQTQLQAAKVARDFAGGVGKNLANRARDLGQIGYEAFTSPPSFPQTTAEIAELASQRQPTPMLDATAQGLGQFGKALVTDPVGTGRAMVSGELERARTASTSPEAAGEYAGSFIDPMRIAKALRRAAPVLELDVYHGTPHRFPATEANPLGEFDASKIGTGEGAQAYGHGIYVAESPDVAQEYRNRLSTNVTVDGSKLQSIPSDSPLAEAHNMVVRNIQSGMAPDAAISATRKYWIDAAEEMKAFAKNNPELAERIAEESASRMKVAEAASSLKPQSFYRDPGSLYKADLPDEMIDKMLDWDKPLSEQPKAVQEAIEKLKPQMSTSWQKAINNKTSGQSLYTAIGSATNKQVDSSALLAGVGIPGIKYLDSGSRGAEGTGTRNFVVFPGEEKKVKILERK